MKQIKGRSQHAFGNKALLLILFVGLAVRLFPLDTSFFFWDETVYLLHANALSGQEVGYTEFDIRPPLLPLLLSFPVRLGFNLETSSRIILAVLNSLAILVAYYFGSRISRRTGIIASLLVALLPFHVLASRWVMTDALAALLSALAILFAHNGPSSFINSLYMHNSTSRRDTKKNAHYSIFNANYFASGIFFGLALLTKFTSLIMLVPLSLFFFAGHRKLRRSVPLIPVLNFFIAVFVCIVPYLISNQLQFGNSVYPFARAFHVVVENNPVSIFFSLESVFDFFGIWIIFFVIGTAYAIHWSLLKKGGSKLSIKTLAGDETKGGKTGMEKQANGFEANRMLIFVLLLWALTSLAYYFFILQRGVAKPPTIEWEVERFLLPALIPVLVICSAYLSRLRDKTIALMMVAFVLFQMNSISRVYIPSIEMEDGFRAATKDMATYVTSNIPANSAIYCKLNCPVISYYSHRKVMQLSQSVVYEPGNYAILFSTDLEPQVYSRLPLVHSIRQGKWEAELYRID